MLCTQRITSVTQTPKEIENYITINVLKWKNSNWKELCPYYLRTDGNEINYNSGNVIFENFYQGSKIYPIIFSNEFYPHRNLQGNPKFLLWKYTTERTLGDIIIKGDKINLELYKRWRDQLWSLNNAIRYPNGYNNRHSVMYSLIFDKNGNIEKLDYLQSRKKLYVKEYIRLVRKTETYKKLLKLYLQGKNLCICEIDVPGKGKRGHYESEDICKITSEKLLNLLNDISEPFGHGLALCIALLEDKYINQK